MGRSRIPGRGAPAWPEGERLSRRGSPSAMARSDSRSPASRVQPPPAQPWYSPLTVTSAASPTRAELGGSRRTTVTSAEDSSRAESFAASASRSGRISPSKRWAHASAICGRPEENRVRRDLELECRRLLRHALAEADVAHALPQPVDFRKDRSVALLEVDRDRYRHPALAAGDPEHLGTIAFGIVEVAADGARVVDHALNAIARAHQAAVELAHVVERGATKRDLLDQLRFIDTWSMRRSSAHQRDLVVGGLRIGAEEHRAGAPVLLRHLEPEEVAVERDHLFQVAHEDADMAQAGDHRWIQP